MRAVVARQIRSFREDLARANDRPHADLDARAYLGSPRPVLGVRVPAFRRRLRALDRALGSMDAADRRAVLRSLWSGPTFEDAIAAVEMLDRHPEAWDDVTWRLIEPWVDQATGWGLSDSLAAGPIAAWVVREPRRARALLTWVRAPNLWRRRAAAYALHDWVYAGELDRPFEVLDRLVDDPEPWVQRAVGTWLRECGKKDAERTLAFLRARLSRLSPVALTVATERTPPALRAALRSERKCLVDGSTGSRPARRRA